MKVLEYRLGSLLFVDGGGGGDRGNKDKDELQYPCKLKSMQIFQNDTSSSA